MYLEKDGASASDLESIAARRVRLRASQQTSASRSFRTRSKSKVWRGEPFRFAARERACANPQPAPSDVVQGDRVAPELAGARIRREAGIRQRGSGIRGKAPCRLGVVVSVALLSQCPAGLRGETVRGGCCP